MGLAGEAAAKDGDEFGEGEFGVFHRVGGLGELGDLTEHEPRAIGAADAVKLNKRAFAFKGGQLHFRSEAWAGIGNGAGKARPLRGLVTGQLHRVHRAPTVAPKWLVLKKYFADFCKCRRAMHL